MLQKYKTKREEGFTIIEVLIVLAIAGLIILIVFLAVPALQRNSRNTQRKNDVAAIASAAQNVVNNTNGSTPKQVASGDGSTANETQVSLRVSASIPTVETAKLGIYRAASSGATWGTSTNKIYIGDYTGTATLTPTVAAVGSESASAVSRDSVIIAAGYACNDSNTGLSSTKNSRSIAILYVIESASGNGSLQCTS